MAKLTAPAVECLVAPVTQSEVSDCDVVKRRDIVDADERGMRSNASAITAMSLIGKPFIRECRTASTAMIGAKPAQHAALACAKKLQRPIRGSTKSTVT